MEPHPNNPPVWINTKEALIEAFEQIKVEPRIAVDTESNSLFAYHEKVCLIQISTPEVDFLIDPFTLNDLSLLGEVFANPEQEKIFHASEYDLICLKRDFQFEFANLFDTLIAARLLGETQVGLGSLLKINFGIELNKRYQRANWGMRPLTRGMLDYARMDTHYLFELRNVLEKQLCMYELLDLAHEDFKLACNVQAHNSNCCNTSWWKTAGSTHMNGQQAAILQKLCDFRDEQARIADLPHFKVLSNQVLIDLTLQEPLTIEDLANISGCTEKVIKRFGEGILNAITEGKTAEPLTRQRSNRPDESYMKRVECLKNWRKEKAQEFKVESDVIMPRDFLDRIASINPSTKQELKEILCDTPLRYKKFGASILKTLHSKETQ